jgi:hypothetical protein
LVKWGDSREENLRECLSDSPKSPGEATKLVVKFCRDIKPENVLLKRQGTCRDPLQFALADFGVAARVMGSVGSTVRRTQMHSVTHCCSGVPLQVNYVFRAEGLSRSGGQPGQSSNGAQDIIPQVAKTCLT